LIAVSTILTLVAIVVDPTISHNVSLVLLALLAIIGIGWITITEKIKNQTLYQVWHFPIKPKLNYKKLYHLYLKTHKGRFVDYAVFMALSMGIFLPVRLVFYTFVTHHVGANFGIMTIIAIAMLVLVRQKKLGWVGESFQRSMRRIVFNKTIKKIIIGTTFLSITYGGFLISVHNAEFEHREQTEQFFALLIWGEAKNGESAIDGSLTQMIVANKVYPSDQTMLKIASMNETQQNDMMRNLTANNFDFLSMIMHLVNTSYSGWGSHFSIVFLIEDFEAIGLYFFYRRVYGIKKTGDAWHKLGIFPKNIKRFAWRNDWIVANDCRMCGIGTIRVCHKCKKVCDESIREFTRPIIKYALAHGKRISYDLFDICHNCGEIRAYCNCKNCTCTICKRATQQVCN
jgi:hypothetical protein